MVLKDLKDVEGGVSGFLGLVTADMRRNLEGDRAESLLPHFIVGWEVDWQEGRVLDPMLLEEENDLGCNDVPD